MKSTRMSRAHETLMMVARPNSLSIFFKVALMSPTNWPDNSTVPICTSPVSSVRRDSRKLVDTSLTTDSGGDDVDEPVPLTRTWHRAASQDGGDTWYVTQ